MAKVENSYTKTTKTKTVTYHQKKGSNNQNRCPVCGKYMKRKG